ncbi:MAG: hypothetical protein ACM33T_09705 [Solirubrobacterales bacterium]
MVHDPGLRHRLLSLADADRRAEAGALPELRARNARELELMVDEDGWPTVDEAGLDGAEAALLLAMNAIGRPALMRRCLTFIKAAAARGDLPADHAERLEARLRVLEEA